MIRINLLPPAERQSQWPVNRLLFCAGFLIIAMVSGLYSYNLLQVWGKETQIQNTRNQYQLLQPTQVLMVSANNKQQQFNKKNTILTTLTKDRQSWYSVIQHLAALTSSQIWFTEMAKADKDNTIQIKGWGATYVVVAEFIQIMENNQFFTEPVLMNVEKDAVSQAVKFEIMVKPRGI